MDVARRGEPFAVILIAADETAVRLFLEGKIPFTGIARLVAAMVERYEGEAVVGLDERIALYERCLTATGEYVRCGGLNGSVKKGWR